jgi:hypothetical protein
MIAPARATVTRQLVVDQPLQRKLCFARPHRVASGFVKAYETARQESHAFAGVVFGNSQERTQIQWKSSHALLEYDPQ